MRLRGGPPSFLWWRRDDHRRGRSLLGSQDDGINVHGTHLRIVAQPSPRELVVQFMHPHSCGFQAFFPGSAVQLTQPDTLTAFGTGVPPTCSRQRAVPRTPRRRSLPHILEVPLADVRVGSDVVEKLAYTAAPVSCIPTRGILTTTRGAVVMANNTLHTPHMSALVSADDSSSWDDSGPVTDVLVDGNLVL